MNRFVLAALTAVATMTLLPRAAAEVCVYETQKVRRACGTIVDVFGRPLSGAQVAVTRDGTVVKELSTDASGEFDFDAVPAGKYDLDVKIPGFKSAQYRLNLSRPMRTCKNALGIEVSVTGIHCEGNIRQTKRPLRAIAVDKSTYRK
jgi:hypothetical protein